MFEQIEERFRAQGPDAVFEALLAEAREQRDHGLLFHTRTMWSRRKIGLSLIDTNPPPALSDVQRTAYEADLRDAAREAGRLMLAAGDIVAARPYFKALGEHAPVAAAIERSTRARSLMV